MGRPRKFKQPRNQTVTFETTELQVIREEAERKGVSISAYIRGLSLLGMATLWSKRRVEEATATGEDDSLNPPGAAGPARATGRKPRQRGN